MSALELLPTSLAMSALELLPTEVLHRLLDVGFHLIDDPLINAFVQLDHANWSQVQLRLIGSLSRRLHGVVGSYRPPVIVARTLHDLGCLARGEGGLDAATTLILDSVALDVSCENARADHARSLARFALRSDADEFARMRLAERERTARGPRSRRSSPDESEDAGVGDGWGEEDFEMPGVRADYVAERFAEYLDDEHMWAMDYQNEAITAHAEVQVQRRLITLLNRASSLTSLVVTGDWALEGLFEAPRSWSLRHLAAGRLSLTTLERIVASTEIEGISTLHYLQSRDMCDQGMDESKEDGQIGRLRRFHTNHADHDLYALLGRHRSSLVELCLPHLLEGSDSPDEYSTGYFVQRCAGVTKLTVELNWWSMWSVSDAITCPASLDELRLRFQILLHGKDGPFLAKAEEIADMVPMMDQVLAGLRRTAPNMRTITFEIYSHYQPDRPCELTLTELEVTRAIWAPLVACARSCGFQSDLCVNHSSASADRSALSGPRRSTCRCSTIRPKRPLRSPTPTLKILILSVRSVDPAQLTRADGEFRERCIQAIVGPFARGDGEEEHGSSGDDGASDGT